MALTYTNIQHGFRKMHGLSLLEYVACDMVWFYSKLNKSNIKDWCTEKRSDLADEIGVTKKTIITIIDKMVVKGFLEKDENTKALKTTQKWEIVYLKPGVKITPEVPVKITPEVTKLHPTGVKITPDTILYNNNINTLFSKTNHDELAKLDVEMAEKVYQELINSPYWIEKACKGAILPYDAKRNSDYLIRKLQEFLQTEIAAGGLSSRNMISIKSHFVAWLKKVSSTDNEIIKFRNVINQK